MMKTEKDTSNFKKLLESIDRSYPDFVYSCIKNAKKDSSYEKRITEFIKKNSECTPSDVLKFETEEIFGIKPL